MMTINILETAVPVWEVLALIGLILVIAEIFVSGFVLLPAGIAFLITAPVPLVTNSWVVIFLVLAAALLTVFWVFKKYLRGYHEKTSTYTNVEGMVGKECVVTEKVDSGSEGYVKLYGDSWAAYNSQGEAFAVGDRVVITKLDGNQVEIEKLNG